jgi:2-succinyl-5-enolpyruvyl-6-hydroxy-3-cyclohexene-1-carboxylate synthase
LAEAYGWPVIAEPSSGARFGPAAVRLGHLLLGQARWLEAHRPDRVLLVGHPTLHRSVGALTRREDVEVVVVGSSRRFADATRTAAVVLPTVPEPGAHHPITDPSWLAAWRDADQAAIAAREAVLGRWPAPTEAAIADTVLAALPPGSLLIAGSSMPVRELASARLREGVTVLANRGVAGIDGTVSTAIGAALAWQRDGGGPAAALLGDLTFLHDSTGLIIGPAESRPDLTVVVVNNDGGAIFALLEQGAPDHAAVYERVFGTPHGTDLEALCAASGTHYVRATTSADLARLVPAGPGITVAEIRTDRSGARNLDAEIRSAVTAVLG